MASAQGTNGLPLLNRHPFLHHLRWVGLLAAAAWIVCAMLWPAAALAQTPPISESESWDVSGISNIYGLEWCGGRWWVLYYSASSNRSSNVQSRNASFATDGQTTTYKLETSSFFTVRSISCEGDTHLMYTQEYSAGSQAFDDIYIIALSTGTKTKIADLPSPSAGAHYGTIKVGSEYWTSTSGGNPKNRRYTVSGTVATYAGSFGGSERSLLAIIGNHVYTAATSPYFSDDLTLTAVSKISPYGTASSSNVVLAVGATNDYVQAIAVHNASVYVVISDDPDHVERYQLNQTPVWADGEYAYRTPATAGVGTEVADLAPLLSDAEDDSITCSMATINPYLAVSSACVLTVADSLSDLVVLVVTVRAADDVSSVDQDVTVLITTPFDPASADGSDTTGTVGVSPADIRGAAVPKADDTSLFGVLVLPTVEVMGLGAGSGVWLATVVAIFAGGLAYRMWPSVTGSSFVGAAVMVTAAAAGLIPLWILAVGLTVQLVGVSMIQGFYR